MNCPAKHFARNEKWRSNLRAVCCRIISSFDEKGGEKSGSRRQILLRVMPSWPGKPSYSRFCVRLRAKTMV
jgi:hypothetical protein